MLNPVAHTVELNQPNQPRQSHPELLLRQRIKLLQAIRLPHHQKRRLANLRTLERSR